MQDIHAVGGGGGGGGGGVAGGGGRLFAGGGGDRRLRPHHNQNQQALKCPRCDSLNTKFCYYNNYNMSQPRHFCKSCRRYWTKGGVLRNVPVGGGCRKTKRSKPKQSVSSSDGVATAAGTAPARENNSNSHSSSESSSLTATTTAAKNAATAGSSGEVASATVKTSNTPTNLINFPDARFFMPQINAGGGFDQQQQQPPPLIDPSGSSNGQIFQEIGSFTSLMTSSNDANFLGFNMPDISTYRLQQDHHELEDQSSNQMVGTTGEDELKMEPINCGFLDQTAQIGFSGLQQSRMSSGGLAGLDWQINGVGSGGGGGGDQGLFDFTGTVDQAYWGHQWADNDQSLNFPPLV